MRTLAAVVVLVSMVSAAYTFASEADLSLGEAVSQAKTNNQKLRAVQQALHIADGGISAAQAPFLPTLTATGGYTKYDGDVFFNQFLPPLPGQPPPPSGGTDVGNKDSNKLASIELTETLYAGGINSSRLRASKIERELALEEIAQAELELGYEVTKAYYDSLLADKAVAVSDQGVKRAEEMLETAKKRKKEGEALELEVLGGDAQLALGRQTHLEAQNKRRLARFALNRLMSRDAEAATDLTDSLDRPPQTISEEEAIQAALEASPEIHKVRLRIRLAEEAETGARGYFLPKVELKGQAAYTDNELLFEGFFYGVTANVSIPFFRDIRQGYSALEQARAKKSAEQNALGEISSVLRLLAQDAVRQVQEAHQAVDVAEKNLLFNRERYRLSEVAYKEKSTTYAELLGDQSRLSEAELGVFAAQHRARVAEANLAKVTGQR